MQLTGGQWRNILYPIEKSYIINQRQIENIVRIVHKDEGGIIQYFVGYKLSSETILLHTFEEPGQDDN